MSTSMRRPGPCWLLIAACAAACDGGSSSPPPAPPASRFEAVAVKAPAPGNDELAGFCDVRAEPQQGKKRREPQRAALLGGLKRA